MTPSLRLCLQHLTFTTAEGMLRSDVLVFMNVLDYCDKRSVRSLVLVGQHSQNTRLSQVPRKYQLSDDPLVSDLSVNSLTRKRGKA